MRSGLDVKKEVARLKDEKLISIMKSVEIWRKKRSFCLVSKSFLGVKMSSDSFKKKKKSRKRYKYEPPACFPPDPLRGHFLEVNSDILNDVLKYLV